MSRTLVVFIFLLGLLHAQDDPSIGLEARLKETADSSPQAAELMLKLISLYSEDERVFGSIRTAGKFSRAQTAHPQRPEVMITLLQGYAITSRHDDLIALGRQFIEKYPDHALAATARDHLATSLDRTSRTAQAGRILAEGWQKSGSPAEGVRALRLFAKADDATSHRRASALALAMSAKLPADQLLTSVGLQGLEMASRAEQWAEGIQIAKNLKRRNAPMSDSVKRSVAFRTGQFESRLGQHENAIQSYRRALSKGQDEVHRSLVLAMLEAKRPPAEIEKEVRAYFAAYPDRHDRFDLLARAAHAYAGAEDLAGARRLGAKVMTRDVESHDIPKSYVNWCGDDHRQAEKGLLEAIRANPAGSGKLRGVLALDVYRDRFKDPAKARRICLDFLKKSPSEDGSAESVIDYFLNSSPDDATFRTDLAAVVASAKAFPMLAGFQSLVWNRGPKDKNRNKKWLQARKGFQNDSIAKLWRTTRDNGGKSGQACQQLLKKNPTPDQKHHLMKRLAYVYRHHLGGGARKTAAKHYQKLCQAYPKDFESAERWLEASDYAEKEKDNQRLAAAHHLLGLPPGPTHHDTWIRLVENKDADLVRKAIPWVIKSTALSASPLYYTSRIGDILAKAELKNEALHWWKSRMDINPDNGECVACASHVADNMKPAQARDFLKKRYQQVTDHQGSYAARIAGLAFKADDFAAMESILKDSRRRANQHPFRDWTIGEWPARSWLETARNQKDWPAEQKAMVLRLVRDLEAGRVSAEAGLELAASGEKGITRLLDASDLILLADRHHESWKRLFPYAQSAIAREDYTLGATILSGLLESIRSVGGDQLSAARTLLRRAYGKMGSVASDIPADSPISPLLQVILHLRLGEQEPAEKSYYEHRSLFDAHLHELPVELVLFGAQTHIDQGTPEDHERAEDILRGWLIKFSESENVAIEDKAKVQLLLARNYQRSLQFDIARAEFTSVLNHYKDQPEAIEARFGIGETYLAQKVFDQAEEIFVALSESSDPRITIKAEFLRGLLAIRQGNNEEARRIFLSVLERVPDADLANQTLYNLAEVYGLEQRYLTQLETLRTVGRLGRESKQWHTPGSALSVVVQDPDLGISRGEIRIPVLVRTDPGGDEEHSFLLSGGAGHGIFLTEIPSVLGEANPNDGILQVTGGDIITVDYPEDFKSEFQFDFLSNTRLRVASNGSLKVASSEIPNEEDPTFTDSLKKELAEQADDQPKAAVRPRNQLKPGNLIYVQVSDGDRDLTAAPDSIPIKLKASSGDEVQTEITEESAHGGLFSGNIRTGELPAGASASDSALDHSPLMAIDHSKDTNWRSEPDGAAPKSLAIDLKELREVESITLHSPDAENEAPVRMHLRGSHDGRFWYSLARFPDVETLERVASAKPEMHLRVYPIPAKDLRDGYTWKDVVGLTKVEKPRDDIPSETLSWTPPEEGDKAYYLVWSGKFVQPRDGALRIAVSGLHTALMLDGRLELTPTKGEQSVDVYAKRGIHELTIFAVTKDGGAPATALRARENPQLADVSLRHFNADDFASDDDDLSTIDQPIGGEIAQVENRWTLSLPSHSLRFLEYEFLEYRGESIAVNHLEVSGTGLTHIPPQQDVIKLAGNDTLELAPGDTITVSYLDELTAGARQRNRLLTAELTATYSNGTITPISYDFHRTGGGSVAGSRKELLRIDPGDRIVAEVVDYDLDTGLDKDQVEVEVQINADPPVTLTATESGPSTGVFLVEIDTTAGTEEGKITVKQGDRVYLRYKDHQNTFPGHAFDRETVVLLNEPTKAVVQIVESHRPIEGSPVFLPVESTRSPDFVSQHDYHLALTVEVIDPDQAKDSRSKILVEVETTQGSKVEVECVLSRSFAPSTSTFDEARNPALWEGRFVGQVPLLLGGPDGPASVPADGTVPAAGLGRVLPPPLDPADPLLDDGDKKPAGVLVLNLTGEDRMQATYRDELRPTADATSLTANAALFTAASLRITDESYREDATIAHVGKKLFIWLEDPDLDLSEKRDSAMVRLLTTSGEDEMLELEETLTHSGVFTASFSMKATPKPTPGNSEGEIECFFGDQITLGYLDNVPQTPDGEMIIELGIPVAVGTNGEMSAFSKVFKDEELAIQTQFHIAESYFELFKSHLRLERSEEAQADLQAGKRILRELHEDYPNPKYAPRIAYLLGQFAQEMKAWDEAIHAYRSIVVGHPEHELAPDSQYKLGQCYEEAGQLDEALESYVTLAATYPKSPLIANVMLRINEHFYKMEEFPIAASVGAKFLERFPNHEWAPKMGFRIGQCHYKEDEFKKAGLAFDTSAKRYPDEELTAQALFWAGESYRMANDIPNAFRRYNRCRWDFPESDAAKYSRGRLALPELLAQFEKEANLTED